MRSGLILANKSTSENRKRLISADKSTSESRETYLDLT